jgi:hypothetical protein
LGTLIHGHDYGVSGELIEITVNTDCFTNSWKLGQTVVDFSSYHRDDRDDLDNFLFMPIDFIVLTVVASKTLAVCVYEDPAFNRYWNEFEAYIKQALSGIGIQLLNDSEYLKHPAVQQVNQVLYPIVGGEPDFWDWIDTVSAGITLIDIAYRIFLIFFQE